jgi:energy-coupling factor transporter ATP-binding protein EcfA2
MDAVAGAMRQGTIVIVAEHRHQLVRPLASRTIAIADGLLMHDGGAPDSPAAFAALGVSNEAYLDDPDGIIAEDGDARAGDQFRLDSVTAGHNGVAVLHDIDLSVAPGDVLAVSGRNGSGKTTLLRTIAGLLPPLHGRVERAQGRVAYLPQNPTALLHRQTLRDEVAWTVRHDRGGPSVDAVIRDFALTHLAGRYPRDLSTGERQRAAMAAALAGAPVIALLDEPTRGMDGAGRSVLARATQRLARRGAAVVIATHDDELARMVATRSVQTVDGRVVEWHPAAAARA